jgi:thiamine biosynthesis lipoprotein
VNLAAGKRAITVSPEMIDVAELSRKASELTAGAFDATIGPLVVLWQMHLRDGNVPTDEEIAGVLSRVNYRDVAVDKKKSTIFLKRSGMILDFGGVAKGYAADRAAAVLRSRGIENGIVSVAGDIRAMGRRDDGAPWRIGIQHPRDPKKTLAALDLSDRSISTSGDYERFRIVGKKRYHHIIDPRTGRPSEGLESVTLVGDSGSAIDPLTTALFVLGQERGMKLVKKLGYEAIFVDAKGTVTATPGIALYQPEQSSPVGR